MTKRDSTVFICDPKKFLSVLLWPRLETTLNFFLKISMNYSKFLPLNPIVLDSKFNPKLKRRKNTLKWFTCSGESIVIEFCCRHH